MTEQNLKTEQAKDNIVKCNVSRSCFWRHHWGKWKTYEAQMISVRYNTKCAEVRQRRECEVCGKIQDEYVMG